MTTENTQPGLFTQLKQMQSSDVLGLARQVADGEIVDARVIQDRLHYSDTSAESFESLVNRIKRRKAMRAEHEKLPSTRQMIAEVDRKIREADDALEKAAQKHRAEKLALMQEKSFHMDELRRLSEIPQQLFDDCPDERFAKRIRGNETILRHLETEWRELQQHMHRAEKSGSETQIARVTERMAEHRAKQQRYLEDSVAARKEVIAF